MPGIRGRRPEHGRVVVDTATYVRIHGETPDPYQYGHWGFTIPGTKVQFWFHGRYNKARKFAQDSAREMLAEELELLP